MQRQYWHFYWPLALAGVVMLLQRQVQSRAIAKFPGMVSIDATRELATFAYAVSTFFMVNAALVFVPQMANVFARSCRGRRVALRFTMLACLVLSIPLASLAWLPVGRTLLALAYGLDDRTLNDVVLYLQYFTPLVAINGMRQFYNGLLVQAKETRLSTGLHFFNFAMLVGVLYYGTTSGWSVLETLALSQLLPAIAHLLLVVVSCRVVYRPPAEQAHNDLTFQEAFRFFWPVAITSTMFAFSRPALYMFIGRLPEVERIATVAALRIAFDFAMMFHNPLNQFRHLFPTFGKQNLPEMRLFMTVIMLVATGSMIVVAATPLSGWVFGELMGVEPHVVTLAVRAIWVLSLTPILITARNYYHGIALIDRATGGMAIGGVCRIFAIVGLAFAAQLTGMLDATSAAGVLIFGFAVEMLVSAYFIHHRQTKSVS